MHIYPKSQSELFGIFKKLQDVHYLDWVSEGLYNVWLLSMRPPVGRCILSGFNTVPVTSQEVIRWKALQKSKNSGVWLQLPRLWLLYRFSSCCFAASTAAQHTPRARCLFAPPDVLEL